MELAIGVLFLAFMYRTLLSGGANLPVREINTYKGVVWILWYTKWDLVRVFLFHMVLLVSLWTAALMEYDGHGWPRRMLWFAAAVGVIGLAIWPALHPLPLVASGSSRDVPLWTGLVAALAGIAVGLIGWGIATLLRWRLVTTTSSDTPEKARPKALAEAGASSRSTVRDGRGLDRPVPRLADRSGACAGGRAVSGDSSRAAASCTVWTAAFTTSVLWFWRPLYQLSLGLFSS